MAIKSLSDFVKENQIDMTKQYSAKQIQDTTWNKSQKKMLTRYQPPKKEDKGNFFQRSLYTAGDILSDILHAPVKAGRSTAQLIMGGVSLIEDMLGYDEAAKRLQKKVFDPNSKANKMLDKYDIIGRANEIFEEKSYYPEKGDIITESIGDILLFNSAGQVSKGLETATMFMPSAGETLQESYQKEGVTDAQAWSRALTAGGISVLTERMFGLFSEGKGIDTKLANKATEQLKHGISKVMVRQGIQATSEATEEVIEYALNQVRDRAIDAISNGKGAKFHEDWDWEQVGEQAAGAFLSSLVFGGIQTTVDIHDIKAETGKNTKQAIKEYSKQLDTENGALSKKEKEVAKKMVRDQVQEIIDKGEQPTAKQIKKIQKNVENDIIKGNVSTKDIEGALRVKDYVTKETQDAEKQLGRKANQTEMASITKKAQERFQQSLEDSPYLQNVYTQEALKSQNFNYDTDNVENEYSKGVYESATAYLNDTTNAHNLADTIAKLSADQSTPYEFTNNEALKNLGLNVEGKSVNGLEVTDENGNKKILINVDSNNALNAIVGHETTHLLEDNPDEYKDLKDAVFNYAIEKGEYYDRKNKVTEIYKDIKDANVERELTADLVGDYLFTDDEFVKSLATNKPTLFQRIKEIIDDLIIRFKGTKEERLLREMQKSFREAYRATASKKIDVGSRQIVQDKKQRVFQEERAKVQQQEKKQEKQEVKEEVKKETRKKEENILPITEKTEEKKKLPTKEEMKKEVKLTEKEKGQEKKSLTLQEQLEKQGERVLREAESKRQAMIENFKTYLEENNITKPTQEDINNSLIDNLGYDNEQSISDNARDEKLYNKYVREYMKKNNIPFEEIKGNKYSLSKDSQGRELTKAQQEYFKDSKVIDKNGNLEVMYHGTPYGGFNKFTPVYMGSKDQGGYFGYGYYFTNDKQVASYYADEDFISEDERTTEPGEYGNVEIKEVYLNVTNPYYVNGSEVEYEQGALEKLLGTSNPYESTRTLQDQGYDGVIYENEDGGKEITIFDSNQVKNIDNENPTDSSDIRYSLSVKEANTGVDNQGEKVKPGMQKYMADSKATDEQGNIIRVYHTTTDKIAQFNEFNPVGTPNYRFGDQVVNFYTNSKTMSGSYADYDYKMANTRTTKLNSMQEANKYITNFNKNNNDNFEIVKDTTTKDGYMLMRGNVTYQEYTSKNILLRSVVDDINNITGEKAKYQYEGYLNITNPYIVDAKESNWDEIITGYDEISVRHAKEIRQEIKDELIELADKSKVEYNLIDTRRKQIKDEIDSLRNREYFTVLGLGDPRFRDEVIPQFTGKEKTRIKNLLDEYYRITEKPNFPDNYFRDNVEELAEKIKQENNVYFEPMELYKMASNNFEDSAIEETFAKKDSTNDIIKYVLNENKQGRANYDGVIIQKVMDYGSTNAFDELGAAQDVYVTFNSNQFKAVDNESPTEDSDIRYSMSNEGETPERIPGGIYGEDIRYQEQEEIPNLEDILPVAKSVKTGKASKAEKTSLPLTKNQETLRVAAENIANEINTTGDFDATRQRGWIETLKNSDAIEDKSFLKDLDFDKLKYQVQTNQKSLDTANDYIKSNGYENSLNHVKDLIRSEKTPSASDIALMQRMTQEAIKNKDYQTAQDLIMDTAILGTDLGQAVQALSIIKKLTPEGQLKLYTKIVNRAKIRGEKAFRDVEITPNMVENILDAYNEDGTYDQDDLNKRVEEFKKDIAEQMKSTVGDKVNAWRYLSMLGNPKTHIRNIVSNIAMKSTIKVKNAMARTFESVLPVKDRTKTWKKASPEIKSYAKQTAIDMKDIITGENKYNEKTALEQEKQVFKNKALEKVSRFNSYALEAEDWFFSKNAFETNFSEYLTANGINTIEDVENNPDIVQKAKTYAVEQAEIATFRQYSKLAAEISRIERNGKLSKYAINAVLPFKKTPINVAKAGFNYSPLGLIKNVSYDAYQLKKGNISASQFIDNISQGLTGTSIALLGYALAKAGVLSGGSDDDKEDKYEGQLGKQSYAINIGGNSYSISWLSPTAMPLLVGANLYEKLEEDKDWSPDIVMDTLAKTLDPMSEMSFLSSLTDTLKSYSNGGLDMIKNMGETAAQSYILQFFPTLLGQIANTLDDTKRSTKVSNNSGFKFGEETVRKIMLKIPGLRNQLEAQTDIWGNEKEQADNILTRAFESFLAPYSRTEDISTSLDEELKRVYGQTGETSVIPGIPQAYIRKDNETYKMSASEYTQYKKTFGQTANQTLNELIKSDSYKDVSDEDKVKMIENVYKYAREQAKQEYFNNEGISANSQKLDKVQRAQNQYGVSASEYYGNMAEYNYADKNPDKHLAIKQIGDYNDYTEYKEQINAIKKQYSNTNDRKNAVFEYINSLPLNVEQKLILQKIGAGYSVKNQRARLTNYIENLDLSADEKQRIDKVLFGR